MIHISKEEIRDKMFFIRNEDSDRQIAVIEVSELLKCQSNSQCKWKITRETDIEVVAKDAYEQGYTDGWKERYGEPEERPQGEWIIIEHEDQYLMGIYQCNKCGYKYTCPDEFARNFCPNCGAKMT